MRRLRCPVFLGEWKSDCALACALPPQLAKRNTRFFLEVDWTFVTIAQTSISGRDSIQFDSDCRHIEQRENNHRSQTNIARLVPWSLSSLALGLLVRIALVSCSGHTLPLVRWSSLSMCINESMNGLGVFSAFCKKSIRVVQLTFLIEFGEFHEHFATLGLRISPAAANWLVSCASLPRTPPAPGHLRYFFQSMAPATKHHHAHPAKYSRCLICFEVEALRPPPNFRNLH